MYFTPLEVKIKCLKNKATNKLHYRDRSVYMMVHANETLVFTPNKLLKCVKEQVTFYEHPRIE